ncbi:21075_t:CDS:2, partial [Cetraspora pellucida]
ENHSEILNPVILTILHSRGFFSDMQYLSEILLPIKDAILSVEANCSTLADCYINLMRIAGQYKIFLLMNIEDFAIIVLETYKGIILKFGTFPLIASYAGKLWQQMGKSQEKQEQNINGNPNPYVAPYTIGSDMPLIWWNTCEAKPNHLQHLAVKLFSITPSSANCKRIFSSLGWIYENHRTRLDIDRLEGLAKVYRFNLSNPIDQLQLSNPTEDLYSNELDLNLNISSFIDLHFSVFTNSEDRYENEVSNEIESDDDLQENEYDVDEIVSRQFNDSY